VKRVLDICQDLLKRIKGQTCVRKTLALFVWVKARSGGADWAFEYSEKHQGSMKGDYKTIKGENKDDRIPIEKDLTCASVGCINQVQISEIWKTSQVLEAFRRTIPQHCLPPVTVHFDFCQELLVLHSKNEWWGSVSTV
jgi:hypothetical protein